MQMSFHMCRQDVPSESCAGVWDEGIYMVGGGGYEIMNWLTLHKVVFWKVEAVNRRVFIELTVEL